MRNTVFIIVLLLAYAPSFSQQRYWQQQANFTINVSLNDKDHTLDGYESIDYINNSPDTLNYIYFHLWPNAYKNDRTAFSEQTLKNGSTAFYFSSTEDKGYINRLDFKVNNITAQIENTNNIDVVKILLPTALASGKKINITTPFHVKLPKNFSRGGHVGNDYQVTQWFPKPAVYDQQGWHPMPYLDQGEFYSEFGNFDVEITTPANYLVAATGVLQDDQLLKEIKLNGKQQDTISNKTWHFKQNDVHDFAWFASKEFKAHYDTLVLPSKKVINVFSYYKPSADNWSKSVQYAKDGIRKYSEWIGDYPYTVASVVQGYANENSGGMEYPTITYITTQEGGQELDATIAHEIGHNWFYGALASNERMHPWMDEGINTYYQKRYEQEKYGSLSYLNSIPKTFKNKMPQDIEDFILRNAESTHTDQPIETTAASFSEINYGLIVYIKTSRWMQNLEHALGTASFDRAMQQYYTSWKFKHPSPADFESVIQHATTKPLQSLFNQLVVKGPIDTAKESSTIKPSFLFNLKDTRHYHYISLLPAVGFNNYDKLMVGGFIHNYQLPKNKFSFIAGALAGTRSGKINPLGRASYTFYGNRYKIEPSISYLKFSTNMFTNLDNSKIYLAASRLTPSLKFVLRDKDPVSTRRFEANWKTFFIKEEELNFSDAVIGQDTVEVVNALPFKNTINRLSLTLSDDRVLYPYSLSLSTDQGDGFVRTGLTAKYYFNYKDGKSGLNARLFAGKFFYLKEKTFLESIKNERYFLNLSGPTGYEDYSYSNYFLGRREFQGFMSQQVMERDGFFKVRSDILADEIGRTDDWLISLNLSSDIPAKYNPLQLLPIKIPLKVFVDAGTYADANKKNGNAGRFLYDAGLQVPLFNSVVNVYFPLVYSKLYSDFFKSTITKNRFARNIAFTINLERMKPEKSMRAFGL